MCDITSQVASFHDKLTNSINLTSFSRRDCIIEKHLFEGTAKKILSHSLVWVMTPINFWGMAWSLLRTGSNLLPYCLSSDHLEDKSYPCLLQGKLIDTPEKIQFTDYISFSGDYNQFGANIKILWKNTQEIVVMHF